MFAKAFITYYYSDYLYDYVAIRIQCLNVIILYNCTQMFAWMVTDCDEQWAVLLM